jgi:hypothetical protein
MELDGEDVRPEALEELGFLLSCKSGTAWINVTRHEAVV